MPRQALLVIRLAAVVLLPAGPAAAQQLVPDAFLPIDHWATPIVEHLIERGVMDDPDPLIRPWRISGVVAALSGVDARRLTAAERRSVERLLAKMQGEGREVVTVEADGGITASTHSRVNAALRPAGDGHVYPRGGASFGFQVGSLTMVTHPEWDYAIEYDPDYGGTLAAAPIRFPESYIGVASKYADVQFGRLSRNWGPRGFPGLVMSDVPYSYDHVYARLGLKRLFIESVVAQLTDMTNTAGETARRFFVVHRITLRPSKSIELAAWDAAILAGPNRQIEMWYWNPIQVFTQLRNERPQAYSNAFIGGDLEVRLPSRWRIGAAVMLDDAQIFSSPARDDEPPSFALTLSVTKPVAATTVFVGYTMVSNLAYRTHDRAENALINELPGRSPGAGLARNFSDYDQITARISAMPFPSVLLRPELTLLRQGEGDLRLPFPAREDYSTTATIFQGTVERTLRAAIEAHAALTWGITLSGDVGWHRVTNANHVFGDTEDRLVATVRLRYVWGGRWALR